MEMQLEDAVNRAILEISNQVVGTAEEAGRSRTNRHKRARGKACLHHEKTKGKEGMEQIKQEVKADTEENQEIERII